MQKKRNQMKNSVYFIERSKLENTKKPINKAYNEIFARHGHEFKKNAASYGGSSYYITAADIFQ